MTPLCFIPYTDVDLLQSLAVVLGGQYRDPADIQQDGHMIHQNLATFTQLQTPYIELLCAAVPVIIGHPGQYRAHCGVRSHRAAIFQHAAAADSRGIGEASPQGEKVDSHWNIKRRRGDEGSWCGWCIQHDIQCASIEGGGDQTGLRRAGCFPAT